MNKNLDNKINDIVNMLKTVAIGRCSIALAGAHAKGVADDDSDIDIYLFVDDTKPYQERLDIVKTFADFDKPIYISKQYDDTPWGGNMDFHYQGIPVEVVVRTFANVEKRINECFEGYFEIIPATWTSNGYYTFIFLSEISFIVPVYETDNFIGYYKDKLQEYPSLLKKTIIKRFYFRANTWLDNFHYKSAVKRKDVLFTSPIVMHTILDMIQIIYALNEKYFTGDKKLYDSLKQLKYCPIELIDNLQFLLSTSFDFEHLNKQHELLCTIRDNIKKEINKQID